MRDLLKSFSEFENQFDYPDEARAFLETSLNKIQNCDKARAILAEITEAYNQTRKVDYEQNNALIKRISELSEVPNETVLLLTYALMADRLREYYGEKGYGDEMWFDAMTDLKDRLYECKKVKNIWGSFTDWFARFFDMQLFAIGRLQYNYSQIVADYRKNGKTLEKGAPVIGVHIPGGRPLDRESVSESFLRAEKFFKHRFYPDKIPFTCKTYLFHPSMSNLFKPESNLAWFYSLFDVYHIEDTDHILDAWRIFGCEVKNINDLPENSSLQRGLKKHLQNGGKMGIGIGILFR